MLDKRKGIQHPALKQRGFLVPLDASFPSIISICVVVHTVFIVLASEQAMTSLTYVCLCESKKQL